MRLTKLILALAALLLLLPGSAFAEPQEQLIFRQVSVSSFDVWQHTDGRWQDTDHDGKPDPYGLKNKIVTQEFTLPQTQYTGGFAVTRIEVEYPFTLTGEELAKAGRTESWDDFREKYLRRLPDNYAVAKTGENLAQGTVTAQRTFDLTPELLDLKDSNVRAELGMTDRDFSNLAQGWRWYLPVLIEWYGVPKTQINLVASSIDPGVPGEAEPGKKYTGTVKFKYFGTEPVENVPIGAFNGQYRATLKKNGQPVTSDNFNPGDVETYTLTWTAPESGQTVLKGVIDTPPLPNAYQETTEEDNTVQVTVLVGQTPQQSGPGSLTFQAVSQDRSKTRPAGTAKWTDWVTATLKPPAPTPPRGSLDWWEITEAKLTYPKKNPNFTFGTPYGPVGTKTINMNPNGHTATVEFQEDWAMDGARIYSMIEKRMMAEKPDYHPITASYKIRYQYSWRECETDDDGKRHCWTETREATTSGTVTGQLYVNGTGVNSLAQ